MHACMQGQPALTGAVVDGKAAMLKPPTDHVARSGKLRVKHGPKKKLCKDMCTAMCMSLYMDMRMDMCLDVHMGMCARRCA